METKQTIQQRDKVISFIPSGDFYYEKSLKALQKGDRKKAIKYLCRAAEMSPNDAIILLQYAIVEMEEDNNLHALELLRKANDLQPNDPEIVLFLADVSATLGLLEDAMHFAAHYLDISPNGEFKEEAQEILEFAQQVADELPDDLQPKQTELTYEQDCARHMMETGEFEKAISLLENIVAENPQLWAAYNNLALAYFYQGDHEQARALLHEVLLGNYGNIHALCNLTVISYYEKDATELKKLTETLTKVHPYDFEHRYKLGATLALVGEYEVAYKWLGSLHAKGFIGDPGFYFWLSHSAYFAGAVKEAEKYWDILLDVDPSKEGLEPWANVQQTIEVDHFAMNRAFIVEKLESDYRSSRLLGLFLLGKTPHQQEIIAHPTIIQLDTYSAVEKLFLAYVLNHQFSDDDEGVQPFLRAMEVAETLYKQCSPLKEEHMYLFQMWFTLCDRALEKNYAFTNPRALTAATHYLYETSRGKVTKKEIASLYSISTTTLTKYTEELLNYLPMFDV